MLRQAMIIAAALLLAGPAAASGKKAEKGEEPKPHYLDLGTMALPVIVRGKVANYVFVKARLNLTDKADMAKVRETEPFIRDAVVRAAHRTPLALDKDYQKLEEAPLKAVLTRESIALAPKGAVKSIELTSQTPLRFMKRPAA
jgi:hypothetical protein